MATYLVELVDIKKTYRSRKKGTHAALRGVTLRLAAGEVHALVGENGAGKTTLAQILAGITLLDEGQILVDGQTVDMKNAATAHKCGVAMIQQTPSIIPRLSVGENVFLGNMPTGRFFGLIDWERLTRQTRQALAKVGAQLEPTAQARDLTALQRRQVEIARSLAAEPRILIIDEASTEADPQELHMLWAIVRRFREEGRTVLYITRNLGEPFELADRVSVMRDGKLMASVPIKETTTDQLVKLMAGIPLPYASQRP